jgi:hypothetical protein
MSSTVFRLQTNVFSTDSIRTTLVCPKCQEIFSKEFPSDLEGHTIEFKCPVCFPGAEADLPYKNPEEKEDLELDLDVVEEETSGEEYEEY